ncbi:MAG: AAA family ATPase [Gammaproteobacteria bacterium]|nr:AAA family ATPase [Gammaproteobacteria bacterium]
MSELSTSFAEPAYVSRLALRCAPFSNSIDNTLYYSGGQLEHRLNLLLHLVRASNKIGLIIAEHGLGKTTLLTQLASRAGDELRLCMIDAKQHQTIETILIKCLQDLGVEQNDLDANVSQTDNFRNRLKQLRKLNIRPILVLDDAQTLSASIIAEISHWLSWQDNDQFLLQAIIATTHPLPLSELVLARIQHIDLPALAQDELASYLTDRMSKAGYIGDFIFTDKELNKFYKRSRGNPALVNQLAHQKLLGIKSGLTDIKAFNVSSLLNFRWLGVATVIAFLVLLLVYQDDVNTFFKIDTTSQINNDITLVQPEDDVATINVEHDKVMSHQDAVRQELVELVEQLPPPEDDITPVENIEKNDKPIIENIPNAEPTPPLEVDVAKVPLPELYREPWVLQQQGTDYTFQLMGSWQQQEVYDFVNKYALTGDVAMLESMRNGRPWYALIYGVFNNKDEALAASKQWPAPLNTLPSWLRRFDSVQKQIKGS